MYLIHEKHEEEVAAVNEKIQGNLSWFTLYNFLTAHIPLMPCRMSSIVHHFLHPLFVLLTLTTFFINLPLPKVNKS